MTPFPSATAHSRQPPGPLLSALAWYVRDILHLERRFRAVTVKRRRNAARPIRRRNSAFRDPLICMDLAAMAWLGVTRLSQIDSLLARRPHLARVFALRRFCDHTTAHNFLNAFHRTHLAQLGLVNDRLLRDHGSAPAARAPILDVDVAQRRVRRTGRRRNVTYRWAVAFCAGEAVAQALHHQPIEWRALALEALAAARECLDHKPRLVRLAGTCVSVPLLRAIARQRMDFLTRVTWPWALAQRPAAADEATWQGIGPEARALDLGVASDRDAAAHSFRTVLVECRPPAPMARADTFAIVTSLLDVPPAALVCLAASQSTIRGFFGHPRWPLGDGKMPSSDPRANAAYLRLATIAMNVLRLFARHLGDPWTLDRVRSELRLVPQHITASHPHPAPLAFAPPRADA